jgi:septum formation protein
MVQISQLLNIRLPLILASKSPRRKKLLGELGFEFIVMPSEFDEDNHSMEFHPAEYAKLLAFRKAEDVAKRINYPAIVIGADTIVVINNEIINKPKNNDDAKAMLRNLSGNTHIVYTGFSFIETKTNKSISGVQSTKVTFRELDEFEIEAYVNSGSPMDKAGAYGIQDYFGAVFVSYIEGCYYNIVGLPLEMFYSTLKNFLKSMNHD